MPCLWVPSMQGIQQAIQTSLKPLRHSPAVKLFTRVPLGIQASDTPESAPRAKQKVSASESLRGQGAVRRWVLSGAAGGARRFGSETNVSLRIRPGNQQHTAARFFFGVGAGTGRSECLLFMSRDIHRPHTRTSTKLANIRVPPSTCDSRQWWSMALFLFTTHTIVVENTTYQTRR